MNDTKRKPLLIANWKMNGSIEANQALLTRLLPKLRPLRPAIDVAVCPPSPYLFQVRDLLSYTGMYLGAQNASSHTSGAFTGEVSTSMLHEMGCRLVLVGHSERRSLYYESADDTADKFRAVLAAGMIPVLCVGESLEQREAGLTQEVIEQQLEAVISAVGIANLARGVIAYEPVWAIGTGCTAAAGQVSETHGGIRRFLASHDESASQDVRLVYGGSIKAGNAAELFQSADVDGGLVGGASLQAEEFAGIAQALVDSTVTRNAEPCTPG
ncbi:MAG: triose-phosphate isomerase [Marinobacter sp.]|uniref:triose-phosphate isomerase n=1 Tax=Marinobacter sp. TaxID=50741 RepID=UPI00299ECF3D|nr:triose-phosphate isomerase [Marinobacter sp.]MDX1755730.1 triose-phosphate isomerase [Marinobacter sp.]